MKTNKRNDWESEACRAIAKRFNKGVSDLIQSCFAEAQAKGIEPKVIAPSFATKLIAAGVDGFRTTVTGRRTAPAELMEATIAAVDFVTACAYADADKIANGN